MKRIYIKPEVTETRMLGQVTMADTSLPLTNESQNNNEALAKGITFNYDEMEDFSLVPYDSWGNETWNEEIGLSEYIHF